MKILVLGAGGMAGHTVALYFQGRGYDVTAFTRRPFPYCKNVVGDAADLERLKKTVLDDYDIIVNCIGILNQNAESNQAEAVFLNSFLPHWLAETLADTPAKLIHLSTDCVFSGRTGPYCENSLKDGTSFYSRSKALGEIDDQKNLTFRTSIVGPDLNPDGIGLFNWFMKQHGVVHGYTRVIWTGVTTLTLAQAMEQSITEHLTGIYHLVNQTSISKFHLLQLFNRYMKNGGQEIVPDDHVSNDKSLVNRRTDFQFEVPSYETMVRGMRDLIASHRCLYPHYFFGGRV